MKQYGKLFSVILILSLMVGLLAACGGNGDSNGTESNNGGGNGDAPAAQGNSGDPVYKEELIITWNQDPTSLDPIEPSDTASVKLIQMMYSTLTYNNTETGETQPHLAQAWDYRTDTELVLNLRDDVKFHNGQQMTASDVVFSLNRAKDSVVGGNYLQMVESVSAEDDYTVVITLSYPSPYLISNLGVYATSIVSEDVISNLGGSYEVVGTGAYKLVEWVTADHINMERHDDYFEGTPLTKYITFRPNSETSAAIIALENGEIDIYDSIIASDYDKVTGSDKLQLIMGDGTAAQYIGFNCEVAPLNDPQVRQAIVTAVNKEDILIAMRRGDGVIGKTVFAASMEGSYDGMTEDWDYNPARAQQILADAGYADGFSITLMTDAGTYNQVACELIQENLNQIGISVEIIMLQSSAFLQEVQAANHEIIYTSFTPTTLTGDTAVSPFLSQNIGGVNRTRYSNATVDALAEQASMEMDAAIRAGYYQEIQEILVEEVPYSVVYYLTSVIAAQSNVGGLVCHPAKLNDYSYVYAIEN